jgi:glyoxylase-like metal-dependent hydrolase (beta-lactamase superfamily II)
LFTKGFQFVGSCKSHKNIYYCHDFEKEPYVIDKDIEVISTPGHTSTCISLIVRNTNLPNHAPVAIVGDLFEKEEDIFDEAFWINAGTEDEKQQRKNRLRVAEMVHDGYIIPGHGPMFKMTEEMLEKLREDVKV